MLDVNLDIFTQQVGAIQQRLVNLYQEANSSNQVRLDVLPVAFKEIGVLSEELQVAVEELYHQNEELTSAYEAMAHERQRYHKFFQETPDGYLITDAKGIIREANHTASVLLNVEPQFLIGKPLINFISQTKKFFLRSELNQLPQINGLRDYKLGIQPRHGNSFDAIIRVHAIRNNSGELVALHWLLRNSASEGKNGDNKSKQQLYIYNKGENIPLQPQSVWQVRQGLVKLSTLCDRADEVLVGLLGTGMIFGADLTNLKIYQAKALSQVELVSFSLTEIEASPDLAQTVLTSINRRLRQTESLLAISGQRQVIDRLQHLLLLLKQEVGQPVEQGTRLEVRLVHQDIASACCATRVTITRLLNKLKQQGKITFDSNNYIIVKF